ncbi:MAG TPA: cupin domain-containing protein [Desulfomonilaceae bacterium]|nr:cupin domain-containing protein [Desulfomonilaceae bacterium]
MYKKSAMKRTLPSFLLLCLMTSTVAAQEVDITSLMSKDLMGSPGKEVLMITVGYPPGLSDPVHRHNAQAFVYVLEGSVVMQVKGGKEVTLTPGQTFYEGPDDVHIVGRNASTTRPAKMLVILVKEKDAPILVPVK